MKQKLLFNLFVLLTVWGVETVPPGATESSSTEYPAEK